MKGCTNDYSANLTISDFLAGVEKFVWGNIDPCQEYTLYETLEELTTQFRRVSEEEQFVGDVVTKWAGVPKDTPFSSDQEKTFMKMINNIFDSKEES